MKLYSAAFSSSDFILVSVMAYMSMFPSSSFDYSIVVLLTIDLAFIGQHYMLVALSVLYLVESGPEVSLTTVQLIK